MSQPISPLSADAWFRHVFNSQAAKDGGVVRRKVRDMERMVGRDVFCTELARRGFTAIENAGQIVIFCNAEPLRRVV